MGAKLPELRRGEAVALVKAFATDFKQQGDLLTGHGRDGKSFTIHLEHGKGLTPSQLSRALKYMGANRDEFAEWQKDR